MKIQGALLIFAIQLILSVIPGKSSGNEFRSIDDETLVSKSTCHRSIINFSTLSPSDAWKMAQNNFMTWRSMFVGDNVEPVAFSLLTGALSEEFVWLSGETASGKTSLTKSFYYNVLLGLPHEPEDKDVFSLRVHRMLSEDIITGTPKIKSALSGQNELYIDDSLANPKFRIVILEDVDKGHTGLSGAILSLLADRVTREGDREYRSGIETGSLTSNKTAGEHVLSYGTDAPTAEALLDRLAIKAISTAKQKDPTSRLALARVHRVQQQKKDLPLPLAPIRELVRRVEIPDSLLWDMAHIIFTFDLYTTNKKEKGLSLSWDDFNEAPPSYPANLFSNRSWRKILKVIQASFIAEQLQQGVPFDKVRLKMDRRDLHHLGTSSLYNGPGRLRKEFIQISNFNVFFNILELRAFDVFWYPTNNIVVLKSTFGSNEIGIQTDEKLSHFSIAWSFLTEYSIDSINKDALFTNLQNSLKRARVEYLNLHPDSNLDGFALDPAFELYLSLKNLESPVRAELQSIKDDHLQFLKILKDQNNTDLNTTNITQRVKEQQSKSRAIAEKNRTFVEEKLNQNVPLTPELMWTINHDTIQEILTTFPEMDHIIKSVLLTMLNKSNGFLFGPPGGAKTAIIKAFLDAELNFINTTGVSRFVEVFLNRLKGDHPELFKPFILQCHQLRPEQHLIGFPNIEKQLSEEGGLEWDTTRSLAGRVYLYGLIDELEKSNTAFSGTLVSLMDDIDNRTVNYGAITIPATLRALFLTSNKTPAEYLQSFGAKDRKTGLGILYRSPQKAFVPNKFGRIESLVDYLAKLNAGLAPEIQGPLAIHLVEPLVEKAVHRFFEGDLENHVEPNEEMAHLIFEIAEALDIERLRKEEETLRKHHSEPRIYPNFYIRSHITNGRSDQALITTLLASKIIQQLIEGVRYQDIDYDFTMNDLGLIADALIYSAPFEFKSTVNHEGFYELELSTEKINRLITNGHYDSRVVYTLNYIKSEADDLLRIANPILKRVQVDHRDLVHKYPNLFSIPSTNKSTSISDSSN